MTTILRKDIIKNMELKYIIIVAAVAFVLLIVAGLAVVNYSTEEMVSKFNKISNHVTGTTPLEFAKLINEVHFNNALVIKLNDKMFSDCISGNNLTLCSKYANENNLAGLAICAHELGHAYQFKNEQKRMMVQAKRIALSKATSRLTMPLMIAGIIGLIVSYLWVGIGLIALGIISLIIALVAKFSTLKLEKDASNKALELLETYASFTNEELNLAKKFLNSAKQTYVAEILKVVLAWTMLVKK